MVISDLDVTKCPNCGCYFGTPDGFLGNRMEDKRDFWCPNGHVMSYRESEADKLRRERDRLKQDAARLEDERRMASLRAEEAEGRAYKAERAHRLLKKRTAAGTCPCCQRTFSNMSTHMKRQHPEFVADTGAKVVPIKAVSSH